MAKLGGKLTSHVIGALRTLRKGENPGYRLAWYFEMAMIKRTNPNAKE
jgi:hypothetical protein